jgi:hypothetical protein
MHLSMTLLATAGPAWIGILIVAIGVVLLGIGLFVLLMLNRQP